MYILYLDESGDPQAWGENENFVLAGVAVFEGEVNGFAKRVNDVQRQMFPDISVPVEFHAQHMLKGKGVWRHELEADRLEKVGAIYQAIGARAFPGTILFGVCVHRSAPGVSLDALEIALEEICGRFNTFLVRQAKAGYVDKGLLILDKSRSEQRYRDLADRFQRIGVRLGHVGNLVDIPYFTESHHTRMMQVADFVAHALYQYYEHGDDRFLNPILKRFDHLAGRRRPVGLSHATRHSPCHCPAVHPPLAPTADPTEKRGSGPPPA